MQELPTIQPWHGFTAMFVTFWAVSAYFDHFLMTTVFCIAFGVLSEIFVKTAYGAQADKTPKILETKKKQLEDLVSLATEQEQDLARENKEEEEELVATIDIDDDEEEDEDDEEEMDDDGPPPPLPVRDYEDDQEDIKTEDVLIDLTEDCDLERAKAEGEGEAEGEGGQMIAKETERNDVNNSSFVLQSHSCQLESSDLPIDAEVGQEEEAVIDIVTDIDNEVEDGDIVTEVTVNENENDQGVTDIITVADIDNEEEATDIDNELTANNIATGDTDDVLEIPLCPIVSETVSQGKTEAALQNGLNDEADLLLTDGAACHDEIPQAQEDGLLTSEPEEPEVKSSDVENIDIDLADPAVEAAATKIQSAFKGYKTRKKIENNSQ